MAILPSLCGVLIILDAIIVLFLVLIVVSAILYFKKRKYLKYALIPSVLAAILYLLIYLYTEPYPSGYLPCNGLF